MQSRAEQSRAAGIISEGVPARQGYRKPRRGYAYSKYIHLIRDTADTLDIYEHFIRGIKFSPLKLYEVFKK